MTLRLTTGLRNEILGKAPSFPDLSKIIVDAVGNTDFVPSTSSASGNPEIQNTVDDLSIYAAGDMITIGGPNSNNGIFVVQNVQSTDIIEVQEEVVAETGQAAFLGIVDGGSLREILKNGILVIFEGTQPSSAEKDESAYKILCKITLASGTFSAGSGLNGINFEPVSGGTLSKKSGETWSGVNVATGVAGWFRFYDNDYVTGPSQTAKRFDGAIAVSGAQLNLTNTSLFSGVETTLGTFNATMPAS